MIQLLLACLIGLSSVAPAHAQGWPGPDGVHAMIADAAERHGTSVWVLETIVSCETGGTFRVDRIGSLGERGVAQWLPGHGNAWRMTSHAAAGVDIVALYRAGSPDAPWLDIDGLAQVWANNPAQARREWFFCARRLS